MVQTFMSHFVIQPPRKKVKYGNPLLTWQNMPFFSVPMHNFSQNPNTHSDDEVGNLKARIADLEKFLQKAMKKKKFEEITCCREKAF